MKQFVVGPVLGFRGVKEGYWCTSALVVLRATAAPPQLQFSVAEISGSQHNVVLLLEHQNYFVWRLDWAVKQIATEQTVTYSVNAGPMYQYVIPPLHSSFRICYGSCFGVHTLKDINKMKKKNAMWKVLRREHQNKPYHLFVLGGDQVYSDQVWENVVPLQKWLSLSLKKRLQASFTPAMQQQVAHFYFQLYIQMWSQKGPATMLRQVPTLMMWDDHDIFDGWGSYLPELQESAVFQGIYAQAHKHFHVFQLQAKDHADLGAAIPLGHTGYTYAHRFGDLAIVDLDLRSERTVNQVMSLETHQSLRTWLENELTLEKKPDTKPEQKLKHLIVLSGIPIVNADLTLLEAALDLRPGQQRMEDDLKDQWLSRAHQEERLRLIQELFKLSKQARCRVTIVSGDAHLAFTGYLQLHAEPEASDPEMQIHQLTSSAMVNLPPPGIVIFMMEKLLAGKTEKVNDHITAYLQNFPGTERHLIGARNWLSLSVDQTAGIMAEWFVEGEPQPYTKLIPPFL